MTKKKKSPHKIGRMGERIVFNLLPGAEWNNNEFESYVDYDILWKGLKIDVKTSTYRNISGSFQINTRVSQTGTRPDVYILVGIDLDRNKNFFWAIVNPKVGSVLKSEHESCTEGELQDLIFKTIIRKEGD